MMVNFKVTVSEHDIQHGIPLSCGRCPVALAITRATSQSSVSVEPARVFIHGTNGGYVQLPEALSGWIQRFDHGSKRECYPFSFRLPIPVEML